MVYQKNNKYKKNNKFQKYNPYQKSNKRTQQIKWKRASLQKKGFFFFRVGKKKKKKLLQIFLKKPWQKYIGNLDFFKREKSLLPTTKTLRKKNLSQINQKLESSKLSPLFFKPWVKGRKIFSTDRQKYLKELYSQYKSKLKEKERKNFFQTYFGEILKTAYLNSPDLKGLWVSARILLSYKKKRRKKKKKFDLKKAPWVLVKPQAKQYQKLITSLQKGWLYENLLKKKQSPNAIYFNLDRPETAFQSHFKQQAKEPWLDPLIFKRWAYFGLIERNRKEIRKQHRPLQMKEYLRKRNPRFQKRNKLYWWRRKLLFEFYLNNRIKKKKFQRIQQILEKIYFPFYGNFQKKQFQAIAKSHKNRKSKFLTRNEKILTFLENRLDVVVYRLNLAPNIFWARRLIQEGSIFVINSFSFQNWIEMYNQIKHYMFPLKLRDPKNLYKTKNWNPNKNLSKFKFFLKPIKKIHYLVKPGDLIQSAKTLKINKMKSNTRLFKKPMNKNFYTIKKIQKYSWSNATQSPKAFSFFKWKEPAKHITAALFLFDAQFTDFKRNDRARELFFRWITF